MLTQLLIRQLIKNPRAVSETKTRTAYGKLASIVGIVCNAVLFAGKLTAGLISGSIAITADAVNNLSDASSNVVSLIGFRLGAKAPDKEHPYGHARYEYLAGLSVSVMIVAIGISLGKDSVVKIITPEPVGFSLLSIAILAISVVIKIWMSFFNRHIGDLIGSETLKAAAADSRNDVISTCAVIFSTIACYFTGYALIDGIMGLLVAIFVVYSGISLVRDTMSPLLGESPDPTLVGRIEDKVMRYPGVLGVHDLLVHDYGPGHQFASLHVEMPAELDPMACHDLIDRIETEFLEDENLQVTIHCDPIVTADDRVVELRRSLAKAVAELDPDLTIHDLRTVPCQAHVNVFFDLVFPPGFKKDRDEIVGKVGEILKEMDGQYVPKIKCEQSFSSRIG